MRLRHDGLSSAQGARMSIEIDVERLVREGEDAYGRRDWVTARDALLAARRAGQLGADALFILAESAWWLGIVEEASNAHHRAYEGYLAEDRLREAAVCALYIGYNFSLRGDEARASAWIGRAESALAELPEGPEHAYIAYLEFEAALDAWEFESGLAAAARVQDSGRRFGDPSLRALAVMAEGRIRVRQGDVAMGMRLLDQAMLAALSDEIDPGWAGNIYCHLMRACYELADWRRAAEWTEATARWCEAMPGAGPFIGHCRVHRAQVLHIQGRWDEAEAEASRVCNEVQHFDVSTIGGAHYQLAELRRLRGDLDGAEDAYRRAHELGTSPQPGLSLLRLQQGKTRAALAAIQAALAGGSPDRHVNARLNEALVDIAIAAGALDTAREGAARLRETAEFFGGPALAAAAHRTAGLVALADGDYQGALHELNMAIGCWQGLDAPYEIARVRCHLSRAYAALGDDESARLERDTALRVFERLGASPELALARSPVAASAIPGGLTPREYEVLVMAAQGQSNQEIARTLVLSIRTVERHLANIYEKLGLNGHSARAAAVGFAYREGLIQD
jgi:ATP/maltotriose-dependent transcriptional regulator MalT